MKVWKLTFPKGVQMDEEVIQLNLLGFLTNGLGQAVIIKLPQEKIHSFMTPAGNTLQEFLQRLQEEACVTVEPLN